MEKLDFYLKKVKYDIKRIGVFNSLRHVLSKIGLCTMDYYKCLVDNYYLGLKEEDYINELSEWYNVFTGKSSENILNPKTFNDKIQWLKLNDCLELKTICADKYKVRDYVKQKIGSNYLIEQYGVWDRFSDIPFEILPSKFVIKANQGSGMNMVILDKEHANMGTIERECNKWLDTIFGYFGLEMQYVNIKRKLIVEKYIEEMNGDLHDFKIHCFNGIPKCIQVIGNRNLEKHIAKEMFYDINWNKMNISATYDLYEEDICRPKNLDEMIDVARKLSEGFIYVRVDLYEIENEIKFGEMTFTSANGLADWNIKEANELLGSWIEIG